MRQCSTRMVAPSTFSRAHAIMNFDPAEIAYVPTTGVRRIYETPLLAASDSDLEGYGCLVDAPESFPIEIVRWPAQGWRPIREFGRPRRHHRGDLRILVEGRNPLCSQQRCRRQLSFWLEQLAGGGGDRRSSKAASPRARLAR